MPIRRRTTAAVLGLCAALASPRPAGAEGSIVVVPGIKVGVVGGERLAATAARLEPFRRRLAAELGTSVDIVALKDGLTLVDALAANRVQYAILSASAYAAAWRVCGCIEPAAAPRSADGSHAYRAVLMVRAGSEARSIGDLEGASVAAADAASVAGRLLPFAELAAAGREPARFFGRIETVPGPEAGLRLLLAGKVDAAFAWSGLDGAEPRGPLVAMAERGQSGAADLRVAWSSRPIPHGPHAIRSDLAPYLKTRIRDTLVRLKDDDPDAYEAAEPGFDGGFTAVTHAEYEPLLVLVTPAAKPAPQLYGTEEETRGRR